MLRRPFALAISSVLILLSGAACSEPEPTKQPQGELEIRSSSRLVEGIPQRVHVTERRTWESGNVDFRHQRLLRAECPDDACTTEIVGMDLIVTPKRSGRVPLRVVADPGYADPERTFDLDVGPSRLTVFYDPFQSSGARDVVASGTIVSWHLGITDASASAGAPTVAPVAISTKPTPPSNHIDVLEGDATATLVDDESREGTEFDVGVASGARYEIHFGAPGHVVLRVGLGALERTLNVDVVDPSTATRLAIHAAVPGRLRGPNSGEKLLLDVETKADAILGAPVEDVSLHYPEGSATLVAFLRDSQDRLVESSASEMQLGAPSVIALQAKDRGHEVTPTGLGASTIRATLGGRAKDVRVVVR